MRLRIADAAGIGLSEFNARPDSDRDAAIGLRLFDAEVHNDCGVHRDVWDPRRGGHPNAIVAVWRHCRACEVLERARKAGPPEPDIPGWHLELQRRETEVTRHVHDRA